MQTTIQELIKELDTLIDDFDSHYALEIAAYKRGILDAIEMAETFLEKEKNNLVDFHIEVMKDGLIEEGEEQPNESDYSIIKELAIRYYDQNFSESKSERHEN